MGKKIDLVILGSGYWGSKLAGEYIDIHKDNENFRFVGVVDTDKSKLASLAHRLNLPSSMLYNDVKQCLRDPSVNAVHIATPMETHHDLACEALLMHKNILLEKPMAMNTRDAFRIARLAEKNGAVLLVGHIFRFNAALARAKKLIEEGEIGTPKYLIFAWLDHLRQVPNRDIVFDLLPHPVDILNYLVEDWPASAYGITNKGREDMACILLEMPDKRPVQITVSWSHIGIKERSVTITGSDGNIRVDTIGQDLILYSSTGKGSVMNHRNNTMRTMMDHFLDCIAGDNTPDNSSLVGAMTVNVLSAARSSVQEGRVVKIFD